MMTTSGMYAKKLCLQKIIPCSLNGYQQPSVFFFFQGGGGGGEGGQ